MRLAACIAAAVVFVGQEQKEYLFPPLHLAVFIVGLSILCVSLWVFERGPSRIQPSEPIAGALRFIGRRTFEIYAIQLAGSELLVKLVPDLAP
jgi:peptidoglycan/LPS O-acetylase OafA/YrhL